MKKIKFLIPSIILVITCIFFVNVKAEEILYGDVDGNGTVNIMDATKVQQYVTGMVELDYAAQRRADVDCDNKVSSLDAILIQYSLTDTITLPVKMGDINEDGKVDADDAELVRKANVGLIELTPKQKIFADVDGNEIVNNTDLLTINGFINGNIKTLPNVEGIEIVEAGGTGEEVEADPTVLPPNEVPKDDNQVVNVPDTLAKIPIIISIVSMTLIAVGGAITSIVVLKKQDNKKVDL